MSKTFCLFVAVLVSAAVATSVTPVNAYSLDRKTPCALDWSAEHLKEFKPANCWVKIWNGKDPCIKFRCKTKKIPKYRYKM